MSIRRGLIAQAMESYAALSAVLNQLTEVEVLACLELESASLRRQSVIDRLISRAARLHEVSYVAYLKDKFHGTPLLEDHDPR